MFTVEQLLSIAKEKKASDVHVTVGLPPRVRINGELVDLDYPKLSPDDCEKPISVPKLGNIIAASKLKKNITEIA